ncbi:MAG: hypothetical protein ACD_75C00621G0001 [uncultured bacterium]|nr:MAG: hypothetical protein ACD_75C00621G0001 [uncultured bacterium]
MLDNSGCNAFPFTVVQCIGSAHYPLQGWKLPNHVGKKIGFAEQSRPAAILGKTGIYLISQDLGQFHQPVLFLQHGAQFCLKDDAMQVSHMVLKPIFPVAVEKEQGIFEPCP